MTAGERASGRDLQVVDLPTRRKDRLGPEGTDCLQPSARRHCRCHAGSPSGSTWWPILSAAIISRNVHQWSITRVLFTRYLRTSLHRNTTAPIYTVIVANFIIFFSWQSSRALPYSPQISSSSLSSTQTKERPISSGFRSASNARSQIGQVPLGLPIGRFQSDGGFWRQISVYVKSYEQTFRTRSS